MACSLEYMQAYDMDGSIDDIPLEILFPNIKTILASKNDIKDSDKVLELAESIRVEEFFARKVDFPQLPRSSPLEDNVCLCEHSTNILICLNCPGSDEYLDFVRQLQLPYERSILWPIHHVPEAIAGMTSLIHLEPSEFFPLITALNEQVESVFENGSIIINGINDVLKIYITDEQENVFQDFDYEHRSRTPSTCSPELKSIWITEHKPASFRDCEAESKPVWNNSHDLTSIWHRSPDPGMQQITYSPSWEKLVELSQTDEKLDTDNSNQGNCSKEKTTVQENRHYENINKSKLD